MNSIESNRLRCLEAREGCILSAVLALFLPACRILLTVGFIVAAAGQGFTNLDFERANVVVNNPTFGFLNWNLAAPGWNHSDGSDALIIYYGTEHLGQTQFYMLYDSLSPVSARGTQLAGNYSLGFSSGYANSTPNASWTQAYISQTGLIASDVKSIRFLARGSFEVFVGGIQIPVQSLGGDAYTGDILSFAGRVAEFKIVNTSKIPHNPVVLDNVVFSPLAIPPPPSPTNLVFSTTILSSGLSSVANPFNRGGNTLAEVLPNPPEGTLLYKFDRVQQTYLVNQFQFGAWTHPNQTLAPGEGAFIKSPVIPFSITFSGTKPTNFALPKFVKGYNLLSLPVSEKTAFPEAQEGAEIAFLDVFGRSRSHRLQFGEWAPALPALTNGESFFYKPPDGAPISPNPCQGGTLYFNNYLPTYGVRARITDFGLGCPLSGTNFSVALLAGPLGSPSPRETISILPLGTGAAAGYVNTASGAVFCIPGIAPGAAATVQLAARHGDSIVGLSQVVVVSLGGSVSGGPPRPPATLTGLDGLSSVLLSPPQVGIWPRPSEQTAPIGAKAKIAADTSLPTVGSYYSAFVADYQWQKRFGETNWIDIPQATTDTLSFDSVQKESSGEYRIWIQPRARITSQRFQQGSQSSTARS